MGLYLVYDDWGFVWENGLDNVWGKDLEDILGKKFGVMIWKIWSNVWGDVSGNVSEQIFGCFSKLLYFRYLWVLK